MNTDLLTISEVAVRLRVKVSWVYAHADDLGAYRLGKYLRFSWGRVLEHLERGLRPSESNPIVLADAMENSKELASGNGLEKGNG